MGQIASCSDQATHTYPRGTAKRDAMGVDQKYATVCVDVSLNVAVRRADHLVEHRGRSSRLIKDHLLTRSNLKPLPVDDQLVGLLIDAHGFLVRVDGDVADAMLDHPILRKVLCMGRANPPHQRQRNNSHPQPPRRFSTPARAFTGGNPAAPCFAPNQCKSLVHVFLLGKCCARARTARGRSGWVRLRSSGWLAPRTGVAGRFSRPRCLGARARQH